MLAPLKDANPPSPACVRERKRSHGLLEKEAVEETHAKNVLRFHDY
jgi:hypothetical protein